MNPVLCPIRAPKCNAYAERFVKSIKYECPNRIITLGEGHLKLAINQYLKHYNVERNHQGIENQLIKPEVLSRKGEVKCKKRVGGLLHYYWFFAIFSGSIPSRHFEFTSHEVKHGDEIAIGSVTSCFAFHCREATIESLHKCVGNA